MSGSGKDDFLKGFLGSSRPPESESDKGLNPLDLLGLPAAQRDLINWLSRHKQARFDDIQQALGSDTVDLAAVLTELKRAGHIHEALIEGEVYYRVVFRGKVSRAARGLPENIWTRIDLDNTVFLRDVPLFSGLSEDELHYFANRLDARRYRRNEVIFWQGGRGDGIYLIKSGIVGTTRLSMDKRSTQILAYLKEGDLLGEYGLLFDQDITASATATALSEVEVLVMAREDVVDLLKHSPNAAIEMVQLLAQRLRETNDPDSNLQTLVCVIIGLGPGRTTIGSALAMTLAQVTQNSVVYTEHPNAARLRNQFDLPPGQEISPLPQGYDVLVPQGVSSLPATVRATHLIDRLHPHYANIVIGLSGDIDDSTIHIIEHADEIVVITPPGSPDRTHLLARLKPSLRRGKTGVTVVCNRADPADCNQPAHGSVDFDIPCLDWLPSPAQQTPDTLPEPLRDLADTLANRLGRINQIGIFVPVEETRSIRETLHFLKKLFGSADQQPSADEALVIVQTFVTKSEMDRHLGDVLTFVEQLKTDLRQESMALQVNEKVMVI